MANLIILPITVTKMDFSTSPLTTDLLKESSETNFPPNSTLSFMGHLLSLFQGRVLTFSQRDQESWQAHKNFPRSLYDKTNIRLYLQKLLLKMVWGEVETLVLNLSPYCFNHKRGEKILKIDRILQFLEFKKSFERKFSKEVKRRFLY